MLQVKGLVELNDEFVICHHSLILFVLFQKQFKLKAEKYFYSSGQWELQYKTKLQFNRLARRIKTIYFIVFFICSAFHII